MQKDSTITERKSVLVRTDHIEESREWNELLEEIV